MSPKISQDEAIERLRAGDEFRLEVEDAHVINVKTGESTFVPALRTYLRNDRDRWTKTGLYLGTKDGGHADVLDQYAALIRNDYPAEPAEEVAS